MLVWERQVEGFGSHGRMSYGLDGARAEIAEPLDTVRLQLGQIMYINARRPRWPTCWQDLFPQPRTAQLSIRLRLPWAVKLVEEMRSLFLGLGLRTSRERPWGSEQFHTHANYPPGGAYHLVGPAVSINRP